MKYLKASIIILLITILITSCFAQITPEVPKVIEYRENIKKPIGRSSEKIRIGIIGDQTGTIDLNVAYGILQKGVNELLDKELDAVIHIGDLLESSASEEEIRSQFEQATGILDTLNVPWYMTAGDHDVNPPIFQQDSINRSREVLFQELYGAYVPEVKDHLYYSFNVRDYHFVSLYSHEALHADPRWGNIFLAQISDDQFYWLANDLKSNKYAKAIIVFIHQPLWYNWSAWERVHDLLKKYSVGVVVAGHFHYDQGEKLIDGIKYIIVGATGGNVKQGDRNAGNVHHVSLISVNPELLYPRLKAKALKGSDLISGNAVNIELIPISDDESLELTPRVDMDKVQAMDIVLGELWNFASTNTVFLKDDILVNDCESTEPAMIKIIPIGNPTDKTIKVGVSFSSDSNAVTLENSGFVEGQCESVISPYECEMNRSMRIFVSNLSSVTVNTYAGPLWEATLGMAEGEEPPSVGTVLNFDVRLDYPGKSGNLYLEKRVSTSISACPCEQDN